MVLEIQKPRPIWQIMFSTHHTDVGLLYLITSLAALFMGGALALAIRLELFLPGSQIIADSMTFNRMFTVHGTTLIFLFILPFASAIGNYLIPIMVRYKYMECICAIFCYQCTRTCSRHVDIWSKDSWRFINSWRN